MPEPRGPVPPLPAMQRRVVLSSIAIAAGSGIAWLLLHYGPELAGGAADEPNEPGRALMHLSLVVHGVSAYALLLAVGSLWPLHMRLAWRHGRNRLTGAFMFATITWLAASGLWLYYAVPARDEVALAHWLAGLGCIALLLLHIATGKRGRR